MTTTVRTDDVATLVVPTDAPVVAGPPQGTWTHADWEALDHSLGRYEIIAGVLYVTTAPGFFHQWIVQNLTIYLGAPAFAQGLAFTVPSPVGVLMPGCDPVQPDFVVVLAARAAIIHDKRIRGVPDLLLEILSPSNSAYDLRVKRRAYAQAGVPEYAIVDPATRTLNHYRRQASGDYDSPTVYSATDTVRFDCLPPIAVPVGQLFAGSPDTTL